MKYITDRTGRFRKRPHYEARELDEECESIITDFMKAHYCALSFPIPTDALTKLIERDAEDLDLYADLSVEGPDVHGITEFYPHRRPDVKILSSLSSQRNQHRLRTTLTHEYGHVRFHNQLWQQGTDPSLHDEPAPNENLRCKRDNIINAKHTDWMEWQAGYVSGSILMPITAMKDLVSLFCEENKLYVPILGVSDYAEALQGLVHKGFAVSIDAARIRLWKLGYLTEADLGPPLFLNL